MSYNALIIENLQSDRYLANLLDKSLNETGRLALSQAQLINDGFTRLTWYSSCFFDNYQDVCSKLKNEDIRFARAIGKLVKNHDVIKEMIELFVNKMTSNLSDERIRNIVRLLAKSGAHFTASTVTNRSFGSSIASAIYMSIGMKAVVNGAITRFAIRSASVMGVYGYVQTAADAAKRLKERNHFYYSALYHVDLEMLYFLIEPIMGRIDPFARMFNSDQDIASNILRIIR